MNLEIFLFFERLIWTGGVRWILFCNSNIPLCTNGYNSWIPTCMKIRYNPNFSLTQHTWKKSFSTEICILILFVFSKLESFLWKLVFPNLWISFATASMHILKLLFTSKKCSKTFPIWRGGILRGEMYNLYKKKT